MSRLPFGPEPKEMEVTDIRSGHFVFAPVPEEPVSYEALDRAISDAGYEIEDASISVAGRLLENRHLETPDGQVFHLKATDERSQGRLGELEVGASLRVRGRWRFEQGAQVVVVHRIDDGAVGDAETGGASRGEESR